MDNIQLACTNAAPDLGITIHSTLKWNPHITNIVSKANQRLWLISRTLGYNALSKTKITAFIALSRSILEYNTIVWNPSTQDNIYTIESVQRKATNYITNNPRRPAPNRTEYKERLIACKLLPLSYRREVYDLIFFIKSLRGMVNFNILAHITFQMVVGRLTRNRDHGLNINYINPNLESSSHESIRSGSHVFGTRCH